MQGQKKVSRELHLMERPVSLIASMLANQNRDPKRQKTPYKMDDFYLYQPVDDQNLPAGRYGSAAMSLLSDGLFPNWALFCYKELAASCDAPVPALRAYIGEDFILLAPRRADGHVTGLFIAKETAQGKSRRAVTPEGEEIFLDIPPIPTKFIAEEDFNLAIA